MAKIEKHSTTWVCDRCGLSHEGASFPEVWNNCWGYLKIEQGAGFDIVGDGPWCDRMKEPLLLCGKCIEEIVKVINEKGIKIV